MPVPILTDVPVVRSISCGKRGTCSLATGLADPASFSGAGLMKRICIAALLALAASSAAARADTLPLLLDTPISYVPGQSFSFEVRVSPVVDFTAYNIGLVFDTNV